jgi:hypothetical protein
MSEILEAEELAEFHVQSADHQREFADALAAFQESPSAAAKDRYRVAGERLHEFRKFMRLAAQGAEFPETED